VWVVVFVWRALVRFAPPVSALFPFPWKNDSTVEKLPVPLRGKENWALGAVLVLLLVGEMRSMVVQFVFASSSAC